MIFFLEWGNKTVFLSMAEISENIFFFYKLVNRTFIHTGRYKVVSFEEKKTKSGTLHDYAVSIFVRDKYLVCDRYFEGLDPILICKDLPIERLVHYY